MSEQRDSVTAAEHIERLTRRVIELQAACAKKDAALRKLMLAYVNLLEIGRDRIVALGGTCDPVDVMEAGDPALSEARKALAPAAQGNRDGVPCCNNRTLCEPECAGPAPAPSAGETVLVPREPTPEMLFKAGRVLNLGGSFYEAFIAALAAAPTTGEPT